LRYLGLEGVFGREDTHSLFVLPLSARMCTPARKAERATYATGALRSNVLLLVTEGQGL